MNDVVFPGRVDHFVRPSGDPNFFREGTREATEVVLLSVTLGAFVATIYGHRIWDIISAS